MLKCHKKHEDKDQSKTKHETPHSINHKATQNKKTIGPIALERSVALTTLRFKDLLLYKLRPVSRCNSEYKNT